MWFRFPRVEGTLSENGILLRRDIHRLFDLDLVAINPEGLVIAVSRTRVSADYKEYVGRKAEPSHPRADPRRAASIVAGSGSASLRLV